MAQKASTDSPSIMRRLMPALAFVLGLMALVVAAYDTGYSALPPSEKRYDAAKAQVESLKADAKRSMFRDQWLRLVDEFNDIYAKDTQWVNRPAALFRAAEVLEELGARSFAPRDFKAAVERYELLAEKHPASRLADDALLRSAIIRAQRLNDKEGALRVVRRIRAQYPRGDMTPDAVRLEKDLLAAANAAVETPATAPAETKPSERTAPKASAPTKTTAESAAKPPVEQPVPSRAVASRAKATQEKSAASPKGDDKTAARAEVTRVAWTTLSRDRVEITVELDRHAAWQVRMREADKARGLPARVTLEMDNAVPVEQIRSGAKVRDSLLTRVLVTQNKDKGTSLSFDFTTARRYDTRVEQNPFRIVLTVMASKALPGRGVGARVGFAEMRQPTPQSMRIKSKRATATAAPAPSAPRGETVAMRATKVGKAGNVRNMAAQLGLTVQSVFIDAGHGGKDPGAVHNNIVERDAVLDISRRVGRLLAANGVDVEYSRTKDVSVPLSVRPAMANQARADLFVSIHINANPDTSVQGFETYYLDLARNSQASRTATLENAASDRKLGDMQSVLADVMLNARTDESIRVAESIQRAAMSRLTRRGYAVRNGGTKSAPFHVLIGAAMPAVLVEVGYCTHPGEARMLQSSQYRHALAEGIAEGILAYKNRLQHQHAAQFTLTDKSQGAM